MASFDVAFKQRVQNYAVLQTFVQTDIRVGDTITVAGLGAPFDGTQEVISIQPFLLVDVDAEGNLWFDYEETYVNQVIFKNTGSDVERSAVAAGTITFTPTCTWIASGDVVSWLGIDQATYNDAEFIKQCVDAANQFCWRKRANAGYSDSLTTVPSADVKHGTIVYAAMLYRERGAIDGFASFDGFGTGGAPTLTLGRVMQLLGCGKPQVG